MQRTFDRFPTVCVRLRGRNEKTREFDAIIAPASEFCVLPKVDAYFLGYGESLQDSVTSYMTRPQNLITLVTPSGYVDAPVIMMKELKLGQHLFENVQFLAHDLPQQMRFDVLLGRSFLTHVKMNVNYVERILTIEA